ncbi:MAG: hypothetical protein ABI645_10190 [Pseudomonadota bacterium]
MSLQAFANAIQSTSLSTVLKDHSWVVPCMQSVHIIMVGVVFVSILMISARVLGWLRADEPLQRVWNRFSPFLWAGLAVMAATGAVLTIAEPVRELMTLSFRLKMILLVVCITSAVFFGRSARSAVGVAGAGAARPITAGMRATAIITLILWVAIIFLGRAIAYDNSVWGTWSPVQSLGGAAT